MTRCCWMLLVVMLGARAAAAQTMAPILDATPARDSVTVGDSVPVHLRLRLDERDLLLDSVPRFAQEMPRGIRIIEADKLTRQADRSFAGKVIVTFYRPGKRTIPPFVVAYRRNITLLGASVRSEPVEVEVVPVLPAGSSQPLQDIRDLERVPIGPWGPVAVMAAVLLLLLVLRARRRRRPVVSAPSTPLAIARDPADIAFERLQSIEREQWPARGEVARHYDAVIAVLRDYLAETAGIPARESTSAELMRAIPAFLTPNGTREKLRGLLTEADLVKFARVRPATPHAGHFLNGARDVLRQWNTGAVR